ncbi:MAG: nucleoside deaminase [Rickettsiales bacterium]|nr:nucleoside deaminase [Rickettsiales bacterium]
MATDFMREAMKRALHASRHGDVPVGAVIAKGGRIIARGENRVQKKQDPTLHAEMIAIRSACRKLEKKFLDGCDIYVTLEPCAMCAAAISFARIRRLVFAAADPKGGAVESGARLYENDGHLWKPEAARNEEYAETSARMLKDFFKKLRVKKITAEPSKKDVKKRAKIIKKKGEK